MSVTVLSNVYAPTLGAPITSTATSLTLSADSGDNGHVWMIIDQEGMDGDKSGTTVSNLNRASFKVNGVQTGASHNTGATIYFVSSFEGMKACFPTKLQEQSGALASYTFTAIPATYSSLLIRYALRDSSVTNGQDLLLMRANGDSGNNYAGSRLTVSTAAVTGQDQVAAAQANAGIIQGGGSAANCVAAGEIVIPFYAGTTFYKEFHASCGNTATVHNLDIFAGFWQSTAAITSLTLFPPSGSFVAGSAATLYGIP